MENVTFSGKLLKFENILNLFVCFCIPNACIQKTKSSNVQNSVNNVNIALDNNVSCTLFLRKVKSTIVLTSSLMFPSSRYYFPLILFLTIVLSTSRPGFQDYNHHHQHHHHHHHRHQFTVTEQCGDLSTCYGSLVSLPLIESL